MRKTKLGSFSYYICAILRKIPYDMGLLSLADFIKKDCVIINMIVVHIGSIKHDI